MPTSSLIAGIGMRAMVAALATGAVAASLASQRAPSPATLQTLRTAGAAAAITDSRGGDAIVRASNMRGGDSVTGDVTMHWSGDTPASVVLAPRDLSGSLASALTIAVDDRTTGRRVYAGPLAQMGDVPLDAFAAASSRDFRFTVTLAPDAPDSLQGAAAALRFDWTATAEDASATPTTPTTPTTPAPPTASPPPVAPVSPPVAPPTDTTPPRITLAATKLGVRAACDEACTFSATVSKVKGAKQPRIRVKAAGNAATITLSFDAKSLKKLKKHPATATMTVVATDGAGNRSTAARKLKLKP